MNGFFHKISFLGKYHFRESMKIPIEKIHETLGFEGSQ
jgi:hypothetical protein